MIGLLNKLSNIDKHRHLNVTVLRFDFEVVAVTPEGWTSTRLHPNLGDGAELPTSYHPADVLKRAVNVKNSVIPRIAFHEPDADIGPQPYTFDCIVQDLPVMMWGYLIPAFHHLYLHP